MGRTIKFNDNKRMKQKAGGMGNINRYKAQTGVKDIVRLADAEPFLMRSHYVEDLNRGFTCSKVFDEEKDDYTGGCPLCEEGQRAQERFAVKLIHIGRDTEKVAKFRLWQFGLDKYQQLSDIQDEANKPLNEIDLVIKCTDEKYQKLNIIPSAKCRKVTVDMDTDFDLDAVTATPTYEKLQAQLTEARGGTASGSSKVESEDIEDDDDLEELAEDGDAAKPEASAKTSAKTSAKATATATADDDDDDDYDISDLLEEDD